MVVLLLRLKRGRDEEGRRRNENERGERGFGQPFMGIGELMSDLGLYVSNVDFCGVMWST